MRVNCKHTYPMKYVTDKFLMCKWCKGKIRKLNDEDRERIDLVNTLVFRREGGIDYDVKL